MNQTTTRDVTTISRIDHREAMAIAAAERSGASIDELIAEWETGSARALRARPDSPAPSPVCRCSTCDHVPL